MNRLIYLNKATLYTDQELPVDHIYLDFCKAFDRVPHARLERKPKAHGIGGVVSGWISKWLVDSAQRVVINGQNCEWSPVRSGVRHCSVLGPVLFVIYIYCSFCDSELRLSMTGSTYESQPMVSSLHTDLLSTAT